MALVRTLRDQFDWPLFVALSGIATLGILNLYSATSATSHSEMYIQQMYWLALGSGVVVLVCAIDYRHFERQGWFIYGATLVFLVLVFFAPGIRGAHRWLQFGSFTMQPSEFSKLGLIVALAKYLHHDPKSDGRTLRDLIVPALILALPMGLIVAQPDLGTALLHAFIFASIVVLTNLKLRSLATIAAGFAVSAPLTWQFLLHDFQRRRLTSFLELWSAETTSANIQGDGWHAYQSIVAIGSGGMTGQGFLRSTQNQFGFLPDQFSDFPFPVWAQEHGFLGCMLVLGLYLFVILWGLRIASQAKDRFGAVIAVGVSAMIFWHTVINVSMVMGMLPVVGVPLPLFSYGGSSVLTILIGIGLLMNVSMRRFTF